MSQPQAINQPTKFHDWLSLARISNLPTVWTNVLAGLVVGCFIRAINDIKSPHPSHLDTFIQAWPLLLAVSLLYIAGMILNDVCDVKIDREERSERPLASGRIATATALGVAMVLMLAGLVLAALGGGLVLICVVFLGLCIVAYDLLHKRSVLAVVFMGFCRALVYGAAMVWVAGDAMLNVSGLLVLLIPILMCIYTILITVIARGEASQVKAGQYLSRVLSISMLLIPCLIFLVFGLLMARYQPSINLADWGIPISMSFSWMFIVLPCVMLILLWLVRSIVLLNHKPAKIGSAVEGYLAGFCLIDALVLLIFISPYLAIAAGILFLITILSHRFVKGT